jgi:hypothetical protein
MEAKLESLPASEDSFWEHARKQKIERKSSVKCQHYFVHNSGLDISCRKCEVGFILARGFGVKEGKLTYKGEVII